MSDGFQKIMCPVDFSEHCDQALKRGAWFARVCRGEVYLVHVVGNPADPLYAPQEVAYWDMVQHAEKKAAELLQQAAEHCLPPDCPRHVIVRQGDPYEKLMEVVASVGIDLIVMSTHGRSGLRHLVMGNVAEKVVRHAPCPVFVMRRAPATEG